MRKIIFSLWIASAVALLFYSFTQVDLSLTLSQISIWQGIQKSFQYIGYFNRPFSTALFLLIIGAMFGLYGASLYFVRKNIIDRSSLWKIVLIISVILFLSYNAFSYDLFNYIFDAKIVTYYNQNPYEHKALDYPEDFMLSFMHWTHRTYPYGPFWLVLTVPVSFIGFGYFLLTFYLFKLIALFAFIGCAFYVGKISEKMKLDPIFSIAAFALNPLVLIESLVSAHNDIVMVFFGLMALSMFLEKKYVKSLFVLVVSIGIKYATALLAPAMLARGLLKVNRELFFYILVISMLVSVLFATYRTNFQPWYLLFVLPFSAFIQNKYFVMIPVFVISLFAMLQYVPYLYLGNWDPPVPTILNSIMYGSVVVSVMLVLFYSLLRPKKVE